MRSQFPARAAQPPPKPWDPTPAPFPPHLPTTPAIVYCPTKLLLSPGRGGRQCLSPTGPLFHLSIHPHSGERQERASWK